MDLFPAVRRLRATTHGLAALALGWALPAMGQNAAIAPVGPAAFGASAAPAAAGAAIRTAPAGLGGSSLLAPSVSLSQTPLPVLVPSPSLALPSLERPSAAPLSPVAAGAGPSAVRAAEAAPLPVKAVAEALPAPIRSAVHGPASAGSRGLESAPSARPQHGMAKASAMASLGSSAAGVKAALSGSADGLKSSAGALFDGGRARTEPAAVGRKAPPKEKYPIVGEGGEYLNLRQFARNLTALAVEGKLEPVIGRDEEAAHAAMVLRRRKKNNPVFVGPAGVGKTVMGMSLAQRIVDGQFPELWGKNIFELDTMALESRSKTPAEFSMNLRRVLQEVMAADGRIILFVDELHTLIGLGGRQGVRDAAQLLKNTLASGKLSVIGTTSYDEYRLIEKDPRLERRFAPIKLSIPTDEQAVAILEGVKPLYEDHHGVRIPKEAVEAAVGMARRYVHERFLPDSALDLIDDAAGKVEMEANRGQRADKVVSAQDVAKVLSMRTGIPVHQASEAENERLKTLPERLNRRVIGQPGAVDAVFRAIRKARHGNKLKSKQPVGAFVFLGPTGTGKTELARELAADQFGSVENMVQIDMSEYKTPESVTRLIAAPPGKTGYGEPGQLTEPVRRHPHTLVLLDEIEEAAPEVLDLLLQVIEDGRLTDSQGRAVDFSNTIVIMTSNVGGTLAGAGAAQYIEALRAKIKPKLFNRIGERRMIVFNALRRPELEKILDLRMGDLNGILAAKRMSVRLDPDARERLLSEASSQWNLPYGARPLVQAIDDQIGDALSEAEDAGMLKPGDSAVIGFDPKSGRFTARKG